MAKGESGVMVALHPPRVKFVPLREAIARMKLVPADGEAVATARALDICLGD
jgi:6-phosphofructokinase 1